MSKNINNWSDNVITGANVLDWLDKEVVFGMMYASGHDDDYLQKLLNINYELHDRILISSGCYVLADIRYNIDQSDIYGTYSIVKSYYHGNRPNGRLIGYVKGINADGSLEIELLGNNNIELGEYKYDRVNYVAQVRADVTSEEKIQGFPTIPIWTSGVSSDGFKCDKNGIYFGNGYDIVFDFNSQDSLDYQGHTFFQWHCEVNGQPHGTSSRIPVTTNDSTTTTIGVAHNTRAQKLNDKPIVNLGLTNNALQGDIYDLLLDAYIHTILFYENYDVEPLPIGYHYLYDFGTLFTDPSESFATLPLFKYSQYYKLFNVPLTNSKADALRYVQDGTLPDDVFLYPFDLQNVPKTDGEAPDNQGGTPPSEEDGDSGIDGTPTRDADPQITSNMLTNNNLYWLEAGQLESFITWIWQNAGEIIELDDLWDRIKGLYNDLASAIINIRYFPVDPYYIGGVSDTTNIVLSSIEMPITGIKKLNKTKLRKHTLGEITIPNKYNAFTDYSPYTSLMLYLPFHGWIDLDIDIFTGNKLQVRCIYDHISGTIQYGVYVISKNKEFLLNTVIAKMAVDIPITLQSKNDRDSAIFNNVTNAFGNLLGAGASAVTGNPIGLVMSTAGVASSGTQSAPLKVNGTVGETGAFFMPNKCAVYIKRPSYNRPKNYGARVGFPSNKGGKLSDFSGFTTVYNPQITFSGNTNADNVIIKPLQSEIDEIYTALEKGVIL